MSKPLNLEKIRARYADWYNEPDYRKGKRVVERLSRWADIDPGETLSHAIVRNDIPELLAEVTDLRTQLAEAEALILERHPVSPPQEGTDS